MQGLFVIIGIALIVVGLNNSYPIAIIGGALIVLALAGRFLGGTKSWKLVKDHPWPGCMTTRPYKQTSSELTGSCRSGDRLSTGRKRPKKDAHIL